MPITTILQHAIERDIPVTAEADSDTRISNNEGNLISHTAENRSAKTPRASKGKKTAPAIPSGSSRQPKQARRASASRRQTKYSSSSTQIASETGHCTFTAEELPSTDPLSLGASFLVPFGMFNGMAAYEQSPNGTWEPQLTYCHTTPASSMNWTSENPFLNAYTAAEDSLILYNSHSITASPSTNQSSSEQMFSFASSAGQMSPSSYFTARSSPMDYKTSPTPLEDSNTTRAANEPVPDGYPQTARSLQHMNQQGVTSSREEGGALHHLAASRLAQPYPILHSQRLNNERYEPYANQAYIHGFHGVQGPSWQNGQAIRRGSSEDQSDIQEVSREAWQAAASETLTRIAMARFMVPLDQQNATQRLGRFTPATDQQASRVNRQTAGYGVSLRRSQHPIVAERDPITPRRPLPNAPRGRNSSTFHNGPRYEGITQEAPVLTQQLASPSLAASRMPIPVLEPRVRILIPICISGATLVPPPYQTIDITFQIQQPMLVEKDNVPN